ncbi:MAG: universal stress protein [Propionibacteriales bacterium]|nr:universal stress protein [Propionibacteriales bacterium]
MWSTPGTIVVGVDGSAASARVVRWAAAQAAAEHRPLTLVHAVKVLDGGGRDVLDSARELVVRWAPAAEVVEVLEIADASDLLLRTSEGAAMVVVGSRGRGPVRSALLGSVSLGLVRHATCPVVVVRPGNLGTVRNGVVVGVDAMPESRPVLEFAYRQASLRDLPLTVFHACGSVVAGALQTAYVAPMTAVERATEHRAVAEAVAGMTEKYPEVKVTTRVTDEVPADSLARLGERMNLVVVGAHQRGLLDRLLTGSVSAGVVEHATCPVAVVPV